MAPRFVESLRAGAVLYPSHQGLPVPSRATLVGVPVPSAVLCPPADACLAFHPPIRASVPQARAPAAWPSIHLSVLSSPPQTLCLRTRHPRDPRTQTQEVKGPALSYRHRGIASRGYLLLRSLASVFSSRTDWKVETKTLTEVGRCRCTSTWDVPGVRFQCDHPTPQRGLFLERTGPAWMSFGDSGCS